MKKVFILLCVFIMLTDVKITYAELTKSDIEEIRKIMKEEFHRLDKRIDALGGG